MTAAYRNAPSASNQIQLRIMATSDVHGHLRAFDYTRNQEVADWGLTRAATLIHAARAEVDTSILLDNGDFLQARHCVISTPSQRRIWSSTRCCWRWRI